MELINNINKTLKGDLTEEQHDGAGMRTGRQRLYDDKQVRADIPPLLARHGMQNTVTT